MRTPRVGDLVAFRSAEPAYWVGLVLQGGERPLLLWMYRDGKHPGMITYASADLLVVTKS